MARLTINQRKRLRKSAFAIPSKAPGSGSYPIPDRAHAANAMSRVEQFGDAEERAEVREKVHKKFPGMGKSTIYRMK